MSKVLLIFPPYSLAEEFRDLSEVGNMQPPLGIAYIGAALEKVGHEVKIIDAPPLGWGIEEIVREAKKFQPQVIGISASTVSFDRAVKIATALKKVLKVPIVIGGPHVTAVPEEVLKQPCFDVGVIGEGEETMVELVSAISSQKSLKKIAGVIFKDATVVKTTPRAYVTDLDSLPFPARHLMPALSLYHPTPATYKKFPVGTMITSRGCPYQCSFCFRGVFGNKWRSRSPESVVAEMEVLVQDFGAREIRLWDDTFNIDIDRVRDICTLIIKKKLQVSWTCLGRVNCLDKQMLKLMKKAGCWQISFGIESGNEEVLKQINKGITKDLVRSALDMVHQAGIQSLGFFILGLPGETEATMRETINFAKSLPLSAANFSIATPYPGTKLWQEAKARGFLKKVSYSDLVVNLPEKSYFVPEGLSAKTVQEYEKRAYREFYRNPKFIWKQLKQINSLGEFFRKIRAFHVIQSI